jgi:hypothetical protein
MSHSCGFGTIAALAIGMLVSVAASGAEAPVIDLAKVAKYRAEVQALAASGTTKSGRPSMASPANGTRPAAEAYANPFRAYPPSCLESPLPFGLYQNDPNAQQGQILLGGDPLSNDSNELAYGETVTVTLFRVVCSSGTSATLLEIDRPCDPSCSGLYPVFPIVTVPLNDGSDFPIRITDDPNTFFGTSYAANPLYSGDVFVLENYFNSNATQLDYNQAFTLNLQNLLSGGFADSLQFTPGDYNPAQYSEASQPLPINGYMTTTWTNPNQSHEGIFLQVYDNGDDTNRVLAYAWFTYDEVGAPFWLYGQSDPFPIGARSVTATTAYYGGGLFAPPTLEPAAPQTIWGSVTFTFPDCNTMNLSYDGDASAVGGPSGSSARSFQRIASVNSLVCE